MPPAEAEQDSNDGNYTDFETSYVLGAKGVPEDTARTARKLRQAKQRCHRPIDVMEGATRASTSGPNTFPFSKIGE